MTGTVHLPRLLQLASPALPVGGYTYSQGLEWAAESGAVRDEATALAWIGGVLEHAVGSFEAPLLARMLGAWQRNDVEDVARFNQCFIASRETAELRAETLQMGYSAVRLLQDLNAFPAAGLEQLQSMDEVSFPAAWSFAAAGWNIPAADAVAGYLWVWVENQVMAAVKAVPLGQSAGQRMLLHLGERAAAMAERALADELPPSNFAPAFAIASCRHETQYSRLFRS